MSDVIEILKLIAKCSHDHGHRAQKALEILKYDSPMWTWTRCSQMVAQTLSEPKATYTTEERELIMAFANWSPEKIQQEMKELDELSREYRSGKAKERRKAHGQNQD